MDQTGIKLLIDQTKQNNPQFFNLKYKKNNECDICFENHFYKKEIINLFDIKNDNAKTTMNVAKKIRKIEED